MQRFSALERLGLLFASVASASLLAGCGAWRTAGEERLVRATRARGDLVVAVAWPWEMRKELRYAEGLDLAVQEVNAAGGVNGRRLRLQRFDDGGAVDEGRLVA